MWSFVSFPILMYHAVLPREETSAGREQNPAHDVVLSDPAAWRYVLDLEAFERQMAFLAQVGVDTPAQWAEMTAGESRPKVWITFDDGHRSNVESALPILLKYSLHAIFFITTDWIGRPGLMNENQIRELRRAGMLIGSHGCSHRFFSAMSADELRRELAESKTRLERILDEPVRAVSLPGGRDHPRLREFAAALGFQHVFTSSPALADPAGDPLAWPRIPITRDLDEMLARRLLAGDPVAVRRLGRTAARRALVRRLLGDRLIGALRKL